MAKSLFQPDFNKPSTSTAMPDDASVSPPNPPAPALPNSPAPLTPPPANAENAADLFHAKLAAAMQQAEDAVVASLAAVSAAVNGPPEDESPSENPTTSN